MRKILMTFCLLFSVLMLQAEANRYPSQLKQATIFLSGASLVHTADVTLSQGNQVVEIEGLSPVIDINSIKVKAANGVLISATEFTTGKRGDKSYLKELKLLKDSLATFNNELNSAKNTIAINNKMLSLLASGVEENMSKRTTISSSDISANLDVYQKQAEAIYKTINKATASQAEAQKNITRLEEKIAKVEASTCGVLKLTLIANKSAKVQFEITYFTHRASWTPYYDINVPSTESKISLQAKAEVRQNTGLDWDKVKLTLSNGMPNSTNIAPELYEWYLSFRNNGYYTRSAAKTTMALMSSADALDVPMAYDNAMGFKEEAVMADYVEVVDSDINVTYEIALPYDIKGNGSKSVVDLKQYELDAEYYYYAVPKLSPDVYLMATIKDWERSNLLPGQVAVTYAGEYVGKTYLNTNTTEKAIELTLGTDNRITVKREPLKGLKLGGTSGNTTTLNKGWQIDVKGAQNRDFRMVIKDQYPISTDKDIDVKVQSITPNASNNSQKGILTWEFIIKPNDVKTFSYSFTVKYPKDRTIDM